MKKLVSLLLALMMVLSLAACGGGDTGNDTPPADESKAPAASQDDVKPAQGVYDDKIVIANSAATSGPYAGIGLPYLSAIEGYLDMVNAEGGIDGRKIEFIHTDDEFDPVKGLAALEAFVEDEKVFAIVGHFGTPVVGATLENLKDYGIPAVYFATGIGQLFADNATTNEEGYNIFPIQPLYITEGEIMVARGVGTFDATKIGIIYTNDDAGKNMLEGAQAKCDDLGIDLVEAQVAPGSADVSAAVTSVLSEGVDFIVVGAIQATMPTIVKELAAQNNTAPAITTYVNCATPIAEQIADSIKGKFDVYASSWKIRDDEHAEDVAAFTKWVDPEYVNNTDGESGWVAAHVFCEGLRRLEGKTVTWEAYMEALASEPIRVPFGGTVNFQNGRRAGVESMNLSKCNMEHESGTGWELVDGFRSIEELVG